MIVKFFKCSQILLILTLVCLETQALSIGNLLNYDNPGYRFSSQSKDIVKRQAPGYNTNKMYKDCTTTSGVKGSCVPNLYCSSPDLRNDFWKTLGLLCVLDNDLVGVCCTKQTINNEVPQFIPNVDSTRNSNDPANQIESRSENRGCGLTTKQFPRITGGRPAEPDEWPWIAAIIRRGFPNVYCGGVLISDRHVLTAAHCTDKHVKEIFVRLGEYDFRAFNETRSRDFKVAEVKQHVDFDPSTYENDIALVKIERPTIFNTYIWPVCMPPPDENWEGWDSVVIGWGTQFFGGPHSNILMEVMVPIWERRRCENAFLYRVGDGVICAGGEEGGKDSCQGDSGGPLLVQLPNRRWIVVGIVSWGLRCGEKDHPGLYTMVNKYIPWILENSTK